jgi:hypothetical protein
MTEIRLPSQIDIAAARMPSTYEQARIALARSLIPGNVSSIERVTKRAGIQVP